MRSIQKLCVYIVIYYALGILTFDVPDSVFCPKTKHSICLKPVQAVTATLLFVSHFAPVCRRVLQDDLTRCTARNTTALLLCFAFSGLLLYTDMHTLTALNINFLQGVYIEVALIHNYWYCRFFIIITGLIQILP